uniref:(northern house mosquito) hypothetical protein n=1 Tax=Culex pipiens TaxID=7175 RepID=A0A8D8IX63_CULPI
MVVLRSVGRGFPDRRSMCKVRWHLQLLPGVLHHWPSHLDAAARPYAVQLLSRAEGDREDRIVRCGIYGRVRWLLLRSSEHSTQGGTARQCDDQCLPGVVGRWSCVDHQGATA